MPVNRDWAQSANVWQQTVLWTDRKTNNGKEQVDEELCLQTDNFVFQGWPPDLPLGRESRRHFCSPSWHHSRSYTYTAHEQLQRRCPLQNSFHSQRDDTSGPLEAWVGSRDCRRPVTDPASESFFSHCISCAAGKLQHPWASWKWLQTCAAKAPYVMAICLFGARALSHAELRCSAGGERWEQLFDLHSSEATTDWKVPSLTSAMTANTKIRVKDRMSSPTRVQQASLGQVVTHGASLYENTADD